MKTIIKNNPTMVIGSIYAVIMITLLFICTCCSNLQAQTNLLGNEKINVGFAAGPNYLCGEKTWGTSTEMLVDWRHKNLGVEIGMGTFKNNATYGSVNYLKTLSFLRVGPSYSFRLASAEMTINMYGGYLDGTIEAPEDIKLQKMFYCGISEKIQFTFAALNEGSINIDFFTKAGAEYFPKGTNIHDVNTHEYSFTIVMGLSFKMVPIKKIKKPVEMPTL